jgi:hypothetical protein
MSGHGRRPLNKGNQTAMSSQIQHVQTDPFFFFIIINFLVESFDMLPCVCCLCCSPPSSLFFFLRKESYF